MHLMHDVEVEYKNILRGTLIRSYKHTHTNIMYVDVAFYVGYDDETKRREKYEGSRQQMMIILLYIKDILLFSCVSYRHLSVHAYSIRIIKYNELPFGIMLPCDLSQIYSLISFYFLFYFFFTTFIFFI